MIEKILMVFYLFIFFVVVQYAHHIFPRRTHIFFPINFIVDLHFLAKANKWETGIIMNDEAKENTLPLISNGLLVLGDLWIQNQRSQCQAYHT